MDDRLNAAMAQTPRIGILGWPHNDVIVGMPLLLGSWSGLWGSLVLSLALAWRSVNEEKALGRQFVDYGDYSDRVRYRLTNWPVCRH